MQEEDAVVSQQREQLVLAEKLFGMDITAYPDLVQVCTNLASSPSISLAENHFAIKTM